MARAYNVVDADGHILKPPDLWDSYMDPEFRERRPRFVIDDNGKERLSVEGKLPWSSRCRGRQAHEPPPRDAIHLHHRWLARRVRNAATRAPNTSSSYAALTSAGASANCGGLPR